MGKLIGHWVQTNGWSFLPVLSGRQPVLSERENRESSGGTKQTSVVSGEGEGRRSAKREVQLVDPVIDEMAMHTGCAVETSGGRHGQETLTIARLLAPRRGRTEAPGHKNRGLSPLNNTAAAAVRSQMQDLCILHYLSTHRPSVSNR